MLEDPLVLSQLRSAGLQSDLDSLVFLQLVDQFIQHRQHEFLERRQPAYVRRCDKDRMPIRIQLDIDLRGRVLGQEALFCPLTWLPSRAISDTGYRLSAIRYQIR
jgi:hypothetical protein